jgi:phytoene synthase
MERSEVIGPVLVVEPIRRIRSGTVGARGSLSLDFAYRQCESIARGSSFYGGLRLLPQGKRQALSAVYAFMRLCDDISDDEANATEKRRQFLQTREMFDLAMEQEFTGHPTLLALRDTIRNYHIPVDYFHKVIDGTEMDLTTSNYQTFEQLYHYCYHVASVVGLICIHIFGYQDEQAQKYAVACGIAFQLTNILRDVSEDLQRNRVYLPLEDLRRFSYTEEEMRHKVINEHFRALMAFEVERARAYYAEAQPLLKLIERDSRPAFWAMLESYQTILRRIERRGYDVLCERVRLQRGDKWRIALKALLQ